MAVLIGQDQRDDFLGCDRLIVLVVMYGLESQQGIRECHDDDVREVFVVYPAANGLEVLICLDELLDLRFPGFRVVQWSAEETLHQVCDAATPLSLISGDEFVPAVLRGRGLHDKT